MKQFKIVLFALIIVLSGCGNEKNKYKGVIQDDIIKNALGVDLKPKFDSIVFVNKYSAGEVIKYWINKEGYGGNIDTLIRHIGKINLDSDNTHYKLLKWEQSRFNELKSINENEILYEVVKAFYKIEIPVLNTKTSVLNYYVIKNGEIVGSIS